MWRWRFEQSLILLSTLTVVNERSFLTLFEGRRLVIGRQDIKNKTTSTLPDRLKIFVDYEKEKIFNPAV